MPHDFHSAAGDRGSPQVSIGLPVFNGAASLRSALDSLLAQTFTDCELIISDNASTDATAQIGQAYAARDRRVRYFRQPHHLGAFDNFRYVLHQAQGHYFMWAAADDCWQPEFIEANYRVLSTTPALVSSISKVKMGHLSRVPKQVGTYPLRGVYVERIRAYLSAPGANSRFYGLFRRRQLVQALIDPPFYACDWAIIINLLRWGEFFELDETLMERGTRGESAARLISNQIKNFNPGWPGLVLPLLPFTRWLWARLDRAVFWKCALPILALNLHQALLVLAERAAIKRVRPAPSASSHPPA